MRFQRKSTIAYIIRNFWQLVCVTLPVSALMALFYNPSTITLFMRLVRGEVNIDNYQQLLADSLTVLRFGGYWWVELIAIVLFALTMCVMVVKLDRHMRMGQMLTLPLRRAFGIFPLMLLYVVCWMAIRELFMLVIVGICYMIRFVGNATAIVSVAIALTFVARTFLAYMFGLLVITFPLKYSENYRFNIALSYSARVMSTKRLQLLGLALLFSFGRVALETVAYFIHPYMVDVFVYLIALCLCLVFVPCFAFVKFYEDIGGERRDLREMLFR